MIYKLTVRSIENKQAYRSKTEKVFSGLLEVICLHPRSFDFADTGAFLLYVIYDDLQDNGCVLKMPDIYPDGIAYGIEQAE